MESNRSDDIDILKNIKKLNLAKNLDSISIFKKINFDLKT